MRSSLLPAVALACAVLQGLIVSASGSTCSVYDCVKDRSAKFYDQLQDELAGLDSLHKIHIERPDPAYYHAFEVEALPTEGLNCPYAYIYPRRLHRRPSESESVVTFSLQMLGNATVGVSSVCKNRCIGQHGQKLCSGQGRVRQSGLALGVFTVLGLLCMARPIKFSTCLLVVTLAVVMSSPYLFANSANSTNVVPDDGCDCAPPYSYESYVEYGNTPVQLVLFHRPEVDVHVTENSECVSCL